MNEFVFTAAGQQLVSRMIAGEATAAFTRVETSAHEYAKNEVEMLTALADVKQEVLISKVTRIDPAKVELLIALDNREVKETYNVKAIGVYARDSDQQEILFGVAVNNDTPDPMPVLAGKTISELTYHLVLAVAVSDQIDISVNPSAGATVEQLEELLEKTRLLQDELEDVQNELLSVVKQTAIVNNNTTTEAGFALDARQANPNIAGTLAATVAQLNNDFTQRLGFGHNYSFMQVPENCGDSGILQRLCVTDAALLFESWQNNVRKTVINLSDILYYNLDNSFNVPIAETDICYATKVGLTVELKLTVRFTNAVAGGVTIMTLPAEIRPAYYQKCPIIICQSNGTPIVATVTILPNGVIASDGGFLAGTWNFIQLNYHTSYMSS